MWLGFPSAHCSDWNIIQIWFGAVNFEGKRHISRDSNNISAVLQNVLEVIASKQDIWKMLFRCCLILAPLPWARLDHFLMLSNKGACSQFFRHSSSGQYLLCVYYWALTYWLQNILNSVFMYLHSPEIYLWPPIPLFHLAWDKNKKGQQEFKICCCCWFFPTGDAVNAVGIWSVRRMSVQFHIHSHPPAFICFL